MENGKKNTYKLFFDKAPGMFCTCGFDGYFRELNPEWEKTLGFTAGELLKKPYLSLVHPDDVAGARQAEQRILGGEPGIQFETRCRCRDGSYKWINWRCSADPANSIFYASAADITARKMTEAAICESEATLLKSGKEIRSLNSEPEKRVRERTAELTAANEELMGEIAQRREAERARQKLREELIQSQKMEALGRLAGGIAHDFNNILVSISGYAEFLMNTMPAGAPARSDLAEIRLETERGAALTRQLLTLSRKQELQTQIVDVNKVADEAEKMLRRIIGTNMRLEKNLAQEPCLISADPSQISQVIMNLVINARDAMPEGGRIIIETVNATLSGPVPGMKLAPKPGNYVALSVSDTGTGIPPETLSHIFEPFFTTKAPGAGTGLGLSTVYGIVNQANGGIAVESEPGRGSVFRIYFHRAA